MPSSSTPTSFPFYGDTVVRAAFVLAMFGWGVGFYGPPVFLHAVVLRTGWPLPWVSGAVTLHFVFGAAVVAGLPAIHRHLGVPATTAGGAIVLALGVVGWAAAVQPWQLFTAALLTGGGWVPLGAAGINAIVSPWFADRRPMALAKAYNGASVGGMVFLPLWVALIERLGFPAAAMTVGLTMVTVVLSIASRELAKAPHCEGRCTDGTEPGTDLEPAGTAGRDDAVSASRNLWRDCKFLTLAAAMSLGLFAQIGLIAQLFALMAPGMGAQMASWTTALAICCGMGGRLIVGRLLGAQADRRRAAAASYAIQAAGTLLLLIAGPDQWLFVVSGVVLFGLGIGNATSLPPLIAQAEFALADVPRVVARCVASAQALYAFAPAALATFLVDSNHRAPVLGHDTQVYFFAVFLVQSLAIVCLLGGKRSGTSRD